MHSIDAVRQAQTRITGLLELHGADMPVRIVALLSSAADHLIDSTTLPELADLTDGPLNPRSELADIEESLRHVLPLVGDRTAISIGLALRDLSGAASLWVRR